MMALTVCFKCDRTYGESRKECPHCGCHNYFCDEDTMCQAVHHLCDDMHTKHEQEKKQKLKELAKIHWWQNPPRWMRWLQWLFKD